MSEQQTLDIWIEAPLLEAITTDVRRILESSKYKQSSDVASSIRAKVDLRRIHRPRDSHNAYAVDSSFGSPPMELVAGIMTVLAYGYVGNVDGLYDKWLTGEVVLEDTANFERSISRLAAVRERETAIRLLNRKLEGRANFDLLILDGEISVHPLPYNLAVEHGKYAYINKLMDKMVRLAERTETTIVGIVKRVRSRLLSVLRGDCLPANDKIFASLILDNGEYMTLGTFRDVLPRWLRINYSMCDEPRLADKIIECAERGELVPGVDPVAKQCNRIVEGLRNLDRVFSTEQYPGISRLGDVTVVFYKSQGNMLATKAEVLDLGGIGLDEVIGFLDSTTSPVTGYPILLDIVDNYVRVDQNVLGYVATLMIKEATSIDDRTLVTMLQLTNAQKGYLHPWRVF